MIFNKCDALQFLRMPLIDNCQQGGTPNSIAFLNMDARTHPTEFIMIFKLTRRQNNKIQSNIHNNSIVSVDGSEKPIGVIQFALHYLHNHYVYSQIIKMIF